MGDFWDFVLVEGGFGGDGVGGGLVDVGLCVQIVGFVGFWRSI